MSERGIDGDMRKYLLILLAVLAAVSGFSTAYGLDKAEVWNLYREGESSFRQANELLKTDPVKAKDLLEKSVLCFEAIVRDGGVENGKLFYNIGNVYFRLGDIGRAMLNYRKAEKYIGHDINLQQNLSYARSRAVDKIEPKPQTQVYRTLFFWHYDLSGQTRSWLFAVFFGLVWLLAGVHLFKKKVWLRNLAMVFCMLSFLLACSLGVEAYEQSHVRSGVILEREIVGRKGDSTTFEPTFKDPLHMGTEFKLVEERAGWLHIELADGRRCWIPESAAGMI
jgi:tetratricopeptide (TPR) repeat protein